MIGVYLLIAGHVAPAQVGPSLEVPPLPSPLPSPGPLPSKISGGDPDMPGPLLNSSTTNIGKSEGRFSVSATGAARYTIPIEVPPGRRGLQPKVSLTYDSRV